MKNKKNTIIKGTFILSLGAFLSKLIGALYRIPLTNVIGGYGLGLYQMVFPVYTVLLDFSGAGIPNALAKIVGSKNKDVRENLAYNYLKTSVKLLSIIGIIFSFLMAFLSMPLSKLQGNINAYYGYIALSPSVFLVCIISCFRGYFQGLMRMTPTALSQVVEQVVKLVFGIILSRIFSYNIPLAVAGATFGITLSELVAVILLYVLYRRHKSKCLQPLVYDKENFKARSKTLIKTVIPITLICLSIPISHVFDSFIVVNTLKTYRQDATALFGFLSGVACTIINLPVSICYSVATVVIPYLSGEKNKEKQKQKSVSAVLLTLAVALPSAILTYLFSGFIVKILFKRLSISEQQLSISLIKSMSINVLLLSLLQTTNAILIGKNKLYCPIISMWVGIAVKTILSLVLLKIPSLNIYGGVISLIACYFLSCLINLFMIFINRTKYANQKNTNRQLYN